uniref:Uncharacterized protein n=1 Tax=Meloidogyne hapla TaxID=6305 RepID=A0A1I8BCQ9_MELHA
MLQKHFHGDYLCQRCGCLKTKSNGALNCAPTTTHKHINGSELLDQLVFFRHGNKPQLQQQQSAERPSTLGPFSNNSASVTKQPLPYETSQYLHAASTSNASCEDILVKDMYSNSKNGSHNQQQFWMKRTNGVENVGGG